MTVDYLPTRERRAWLRVREDAILNAMFAKWKADRECPLAWTEELLWVQAEIIRCS